ncbi:hypothetical protein H6S82_24695 [Planktothrix sp. FACHB-1355]|uniref:STI1 domain-containing protein n=1 Tax=Aerosakkonema funiforme FACHB-1375 TaxID=2949571 RepID=A0A926VEJ1_9CYAN|nr:MULTISPECIES: hypothetical protein [Oscillatoriales]MBD2182314.1 hypothetical protein [Aerosakkonema funiforme FACHB-1375]MBD3562020.1 hypothetical protein [Planktothrix sp. FACHB-1355]
MKPFNLIAASTIMAATIWGFTATQSQADVSVKPESLQRNSNSALLAQTVAQNSTEVQKFLLQMQQNPQMVQRVLQLSQVNPQLMQVLIQRFLQRNPQLLHELKKNPQVVQQLLEDNPQLIEIFKQNPELRQQLQLDRTVIPQS